MSADEDLGPPGGNEEGPGLNQTEPHSPSSADRSSTADEVHDTAVGGAGGNGEPVTGGGVDRLVYDTISLRSAALSYAAENLSVFPLLAVGEPNPHTGVISDGKKPATRNGFHDATTGPDEVAAWWNEHPHRNIGCRPPPGVVVLDIDPRKGGDDDMHKLVAAHGPFPATWVVATGGGGWHYWLRADPDDILKDLCPGIELKHWAKGYVCMPPSIHESGRTYRWINPAEAPW